MPFPLLRRGLALPSLGLFVPSFSWVRVGLPSRGKAWPKLGLALPSWGRGWPLLLGVGWGCPALCGYNHQFKLQSHNDHYIGGWKKIRQGLALGVGVGGSFFGFPLGPSFSGVEVGPSQGRGWLFGFWSALWAGVGNSFSQVGVGLFFRGEGCPFLLEVLRVGVGQGPDPKEEKAGPDSKGEDGKAHFKKIIPVNIDKYVLPTLGKGIGPSFSWVVWPFLLLGRGWTSFSG